MPKISTHKFNYKKAVNNRYKSASGFMHKNVNILHSISKEEYLYRQYYGSQDIFLKILEECKMLDVAESTDYFRYERWLDDGGRY